MQPDLAPIERLDSFPYRHRLSDVMAHPVIMAPPDMTLLQACALMQDKCVSALPIQSPAGALVGIVTQKDVIRLLARQGVASLELPLSSVMSSPVQTIGVQAYLYVAIARMARLNLRHLAVISDDGAVVGMITPRQLVQTRAGQAMVIGDDITTARGCAELAAARAQLPSLAQGLRRDGATAGQVAAVIGGVVRDMTSKACELTADALQADGWGAAPANYAVLVLGSAGRGESLLTFDQDNALVHDGPPAADVWFEEFGKRLNTMLDQSGIVLCKGEVMIRNPFWRRSLTGWRDALRNWVFQPDPSTILNCDIFFDMACVHGDKALAESLRALAIETAGQSNFFLQLLLQAVAKLDSPIGAFGRLITQEGKLDAKKLGLLPLVSTGRAKALQQAISATSTAERYRELAQRGLMHEEDLASLLSAHEQILAAMLDQQLADLAAGITPSTLIAPAQFSKREQAGLKEAFQRIKLLRNLMGSVMAV